MPAWNGQPPASEFGSYATRPRWMAWRCMPSRWLLCTGASGALMGISWKFGPPRREICVSTYEWMRPASSGSLEKSIPGTTCAVQNATCSVSAKKLSGLRLSTMRPMGRTGTSSSGISLVASRMSKLNASPCSSVNTCTPSSYSGYAPASMRSHRSRRW
ncbi:hypothetical protein D3C71_1575760 [compost metagenome]